jgi:hypothetical protein
MKTGNRKLRSPVAMDRQLLIICALTFVIHLIGTLAYAVRIAGIRTGEGDIAPVVVPITTC